LACNSWQPIAQSGLNFAATGSVAVTQYDSNSVAVLIDDATVTQNGVVRDGSWVRYV